MLAWTAVKTASCARGSQRIVVYGTMRRRHRGLASWCAPSVIWRRGAGVLPNRYEEGYGLNEQPSGSGSDGANVIVPCLRVTAVRIRLARLSGRLIITAHHIRPLSCPRIRCVNPDDLATPPRQRACGAGARSSSARRRRRAWLRPFADERWQLVARDGADASRSGRTAPLSDLSRALNPRRSPRALAGRRAVPASGCDLRDHRYVLDPAQRRGRSPCRGRCAFCCPRLPTRPRSRRTLS